MKKPFSVIFALFVIAATFALAAQAVLRKAPELRRPYLQVELDYNYDVYQRPLFFLPKSKPTFSIWIENGDSGNPRSIFVTEKAAKNDWDFAESRPEAIPVWYGIHQIEQRNGKFDIDAVSGATPKGSTAVIYWTIPGDLMGKTADLYIEANNSFDFNDYYHKKKGALGYSGANGQPSVIWKATLDFSGKPFADIAPDIVGHGNVLGQDHRVVKDISTITTAARTFQAIRISYFLQ